MEDKVQKIRAEIERLYNQSLADGNRQADRGLERAASASYGKSKACKELLSFIDSMQEEPTTSIWHDAKDTPVASKTKIVLYTNGKWDMFKAYETKDDYDNYWAGVNQALEEKGVLVKRWAYVEDLLKL